MPSQTTVSNLELRKLNKYLDIKRKQLENKTSN